MALFADVHEFVRACESFQLFTRKQKLAALPLQPVIVEAPFQQWGLYFIEKFHENSSNGYTWILIEIDYFTRWVEAIPIKKETNKVIIESLEDKIITRFGVRTKITMDNAMDFSSTQLSILF